MVGSWLKGLEDYFDLNHVQLITVIVICVIFTLMAVFVGFQLFLALNSFQQGRGHTFRKRFLTLLFIGCTSRACLIFYSWSVSPCITDLKGLFASLGIIVPFVFFFESYLLLLLFWAIIFHRATHVSPIVFRPLLRVLSVVFPLSVVVLAAYAYLNKEYGLFINGSPLIFGYTALIAAAAILMYAIRAIITLKNREYLSYGNRRPLVKKMMFLLAMLFTVFIFVGYYNLMFGETHYCDLCEKSQDMVDALFFFLTEFVPCFIILMMIRTKPVASRQSQLNVPVSGAEQWPAAQVGGDYDKVAGSFMFL